MIKNDGIKQMKMKNMANHKSCKNCIHWKTIEERVHLSMPNKEYCITNYNIGVICSSYKKRT
jgi:hypothetical protein